VIIQLLTEEPAKVCGNNLQNIPPFFAMDDRQTDYSKLIDQVS
jgi:hypothetical protein